MRPLNKVPGGHLLVKPRSKSIMVEFIISTFIFLLKSISLIVGKFSPSHSKYPSKLLEKGKEDEGGFPVRYPYIYVRAFK